MKTKIYINHIKTRPDISVNQKKTLDKVIRKHSLIAGKILKIPFVTITVYPKSDWTIPETGENGYTPSEDWIQLYINIKKKKNLTKIINEHVPATIYHEMNHAARWRSSNFGNNLLEVIVSEGLASVFEKEQWKSFVPPWTKLNKREISNFLKIINERNKNKDSTFNHAEWFFGQGELPRWIGYKLGVHIVESTRKNYPEISWEKLTRMKAKEIINKSKIKIN
jgi:uncharacterized protein YjaZ